MGEINVTISNGDVITITRELGYPQIKIENLAFDEPARYITVSTAGKHDRQRDIRILIGQLERLAEMEE